MSDAPKLLLCLEDDEDDSLWIEQAAEEIDPNLVFVNKTDGREALYFLERQKQQNFLPCLILLDLNLPGLNGRDTLAAIKKDPAFKDIPLIVFSTSHSLSDRLFCERFGVELVTKPERVNDFKKTVKHLVLSRCA